MTELSTIAGASTHPAPAALARASVQNLAGSLIREVANSAMGRGDVLPFWFGESDQATPSFIREAAITSLNQGETFYTQNLGRPYLREAIATYLTDLHGTSVSAKRIAVTGSGVSALMLVAQLLLEPGARVVAVTPLWPNIVEIPVILGAQVERVGLHVEDGRWTLDVPRLLAALTPGTRMLVLNSPNNPTGWTLDAAAIPVILQHCRQHGIWIVLDDVYERLVYAQEQRSAPSFLPFYEEGDRIISVNSFSKAWSMTGWRIGWITAPESVIDDLGKLLEYNTSCVPESTQRAAAAAITHGETAVAHLRAHLATTRAYLADTLRALPGVEVPDAGGAMYAFFRIEGGEDSLRLAKQLVNQAGLGLAPGAAFGPEGETWLRWCHAVSLQRLQQGTERLKTFLRQQGT